MYRDNSNTVWYIQNILYCLPEIAKLHQGRGKTKAVPPDAARPNRQTKRKITCRREKIGGGGERELGRV